MNPIHGVWAPIGLIAVGAARWFLPHLPTKILICPSRSLFGIACPACGSGTAIIALSEFRIIDAVVANPLFTIGGFALALWGLSAFLGHIIGKPLPVWAINGKRRSIKRYTLIALILINWLYVGLLRPFENIK